MTNGEKIKEIFPSIDSRLDEKTGIMLVKWVDGATKCFKADWWNAEYEEPIKALEQEPILDKIRAEILHLKTKTSFTFVNIDDVLRLIDKHKESKENDGI